MTNNAKRATGTTRRGQTSRWTPCGSPVNKPPGLCRHELRLGSYRRPGRRRRLGHHFQRAGTQGRQPDPQRQH